MTVTFDGLGVKPELTAALLEQGITEPFPIQARTIGDVLAGRDVCGKAKTGSGKTLAFALPIADVLDPDASPLPAALVLVPTRELAQQVTAEFQIVAGATGAPPRVAPAASA